jgi:hypothetical protein
MSRNLTPPPASQANRFDDGKTACEQPEADLIDAYAQAEWWLADDDDWVPDDVRLLADAFAPLRSDLPRHEDGEADDPWDDPGWAEAARDYHAKRGKDVSTVTYSPDELARLRALMADDVSIDRAWHEIKTERLRERVPEATLKAAEFLIEQRDPAKLRAWLSKRTAQECAAILQCLEQRKRAREK